MTPELGLTMIIFASLSFFGMGWFLRKHRMLGLPFQGVAVGVLFGSLFASTETFNILPPWIGFSAMILLCLISGVLAVLQNARLIAVIGIGGGFMAPLLFPVANASSFFLLGYYLVLTGGVLLLSRHRSWDELQILSFGFTIMIGVIWGPTDYDPIHLMKYEAFLLAFFLMYTGMLFLYYIKNPNGGDHQPRQVAAVFIPVCFLFFQAGMVRHIPHALTATFAFLSIFYSVQAYLFHRRGKGLLQPSLLYFSLGVILGNVALPFLFSPENRMPGMIFIFSWEALFMICAGLRTGNTFIRGFALLLHGISAILLAGVSSFCAVSALNILGGVSAFVTSAVSAYSIDKSKAASSGLQTIISACLLLWSLIIWAATGYVVMVFHVSAEFVNTAVLFLFTLTAWGLYFFSRRVSWPMPGKMIDYFYGPSLGLLAVSDLIPDAYGSQIPFDPSPVAWIVAVLSWYYILYLREKKAPGTSHVSQHRLAVWFISVSIIWQVYSLVGSVMSAGSVWAFSSVGTCLGIISAFLLMTAPRLKWPVQAHFHEYQVTGMLPLLAFSWLWILWGTLSGGDPLPLQYIPLFNPLEISQAICFIALFLWKREWIDAVPPAPMVPNIIRKSMPGALYGTLLISISSALGRGMASVTLVNFNFFLLFSPVFQTGLSIIWSLMAVAVMYRAKKNDQPRIWRMGSLLMFLVVIKLFLVDIFFSNGIARAVAFMWVGCLTTAAGNYLGRSSDKHTISKEVGYGNADAV